MDIIHYDWLPINTKVYWIRSSIENPFNWSIFEGIIAANYEIDGNYYYHCTLIDILETTVYQNKYIANNTFRLIDIDSGKPINKFLYFDCKKPILQDWKQYYAAQYLWDLTPDIIFLSETAALNGLTALYKLNADYFNNIIQAYNSQLHSK